MKPKFPLTVYYDGKCIVCSTEIDHYRRLPHRGRLLFVDIAKVDFDPVKHGRSFDQFMARMHVKDVDGNFYVGVDAFPAIWAALPSRGYHLFGKFLRFPVIYQLARWGYAMFARFRKHLPKKTICHDGQCRKH